MGKKTVLQGITAVAVVVLIGLFLYFTLGNPKVDTSQVTAGTVYGVNGETGEVSSAELSSEDVDRVAGIFNGKEKSGSGPGDVFSNDCAFALRDGDSEYYFCLALDGSNYVCSANDDMYFQVSDEERAELMHLLRNYCGYR